MDQDMALDCSSDSDVTMAAQATQISMVPVAAWPLDINMASGGGPNCGHPYGFGGVTTMDINTETRHESRHGPRQ